MNAEPLQEKALPAPHLSSTDWEQWMNVRGDLDDFIFYYEDCCKQSER